MATQEEIEEVKKLANKLTKVEYKITKLEMIMSRWNIVKILYRAGLVIRKERLEEIICRRIIKEPYIDHEALKISMDGVISVVYTITIYIDKDRDIEKRKANIDLNPCTIWASTKKDLSKT